MMPCNGWVMRCNSCIFRCWYPVVCLSVYQQRWVAQEQFPLNNFLIFCVEVLKMWEGVLDLGGCTVKFN